MPHHTPPLTTALGLPRPHDRLERFGAILNAAHCGAHVEGHTRGLVPALFTGDDRPPHHRLLPLVGEGVHRQAQPGEGRLTVFTEDQPALGDEIAPHHRDAAATQELSF